MTGKTRVEVNAAITNPYFDESTYKPSKASNPNFRRQELFKKTIQNTQ